MTQEQNKKTWWVEIVPLFYQFTGWIIGPIILALIIGNYLENKYQNSVNYVLICVLVAFVISNIGLVKMVIRYNKQIRETEKENSNNQIPKNKQ